MPYIGAVDSYPLKTGGAGFNNSFGFFLVIMGAMCLVFAICALRTNLVLFLILLLLVPAFSCLTAGYFFLAAGWTVKAGNCIIAGGALAFVVCLLGWWIFTAILLAAVDFPLTIPGEPFWNSFPARQLLTSLSLRSFSHHQGC